jgi:hypothetical protein
LISVQELDPRKSNSVKKRFIFGSFDKNGPSPTWGRRTIDQMTGNLGKRGEKFWKSEQIFRFFKKKSFWENSNFDKISLPPWSEWYAVCETLEPRRIRSCRISEPILRSQSERSYWQPPLAITSSTGCRDLLQSVKSQLAFIADVIHLRRWTCVVRMSRRRYCHYYFAQKNRPFKPR